MVGGFPKGGLKAKNPRGCRPHGGLAEGTFPGAPFAAVHSIVVQLMCMQHSGTAPVCAVQLYSTWVCSTVVQHLCVQ